jgi:hypothetical protein
MNMNRLANIWLALPLAGSALFAASAPVAARPGAPPYCVMTGGPRGPGSVPQICRFFDYRQCLQAAADLHGNCVVNIDYPGAVSMPPLPPPGSAPRRY